MKTKFRRIGKSTISIFLTILMIISTNMNLLAYVNTLQI